MDFLIRFVQVHKEFRQAEIEALAGIAGVTVQVLLYSDDVRCTPLQFESTVLQPAMTLCVIISCLTIYLVPILHNSLSFDKCS
jgi:tRNA G10  N-methylase Trm11